MNFFCHKINRDFVANLWVFRLIQCIWLTVQSIWIFFPRIFPENWRNNPNSKRKWMKTHRIHKLINKVFKLLRNVQSTVWTNPSIPKVWFTRLYKIIKQNTCIYIPLYSSTLWQKLKVKYSLMTQQKGGNFSFAN